MLATVHIDTTNIRTWVIVLLIEPQTTSEKTHPENEHCQTHQNSYEKTMEQGSLRCLLRIAPITTKQKIPVSESLIYEGDFAHEDWTTCSSHFLKAVIYEGMFSHGLLIDRADAYRNYQFDSSNPM